MKQRKQIFLENGVYTLIWLIVFIIPIAGYVSDGAVRWDEVFRFWLRIVPFFMLFVVNNYLLIPLFLLKKKYMSYILGVVGVVGLFSVYQSFVPGKPAGTPPGAFTRQVPGMLPPEKRTDEDRPPAPPFRQEREMKPDRPLPLRLGPLFNDCLLAILLIGFNIAIRLLFKSIRDERMMKELESQTLKAELNYLKAQVNPHFFMNTLNNIHALIDLDTEKAKETVIELSRIMRYVLYDADQPTVPLAKEIYFLNNYIALMRIRYTDEVDIQTVYPESIPDELRVPPLLLVTLVENAFKHGVSYQQESYIHTRLFIEERRLTYQVKNSLKMNGALQPGVGLENLRKRLTLLYGGTYSFRIHTGAGEYSVCLSIPVEI